MSDRQHYTRKSTGTDFRGGRHVRGIRNNNPGNIVKTSIKWEGKVPHSANTDKRFEQFESVEYGLRALMKNIITNINNGYNTIEKLIRRWAPSHENNTTAFINSVASFTGIQKTAVLSINKSTIISVAKGIVRVECGDEASLLNNSHYETAYSMIGTAGTNTSESVEIAPIAPPNDAEGDYGKKSNLIWYVLGGVVLVSIGGYFLFKKK